MALFVAVIVGVVVALTWLDWRDTRKTFVVPEWAKGTALAAIVAASLTAATSFASFWLQDPASSSGPFGSPLFWPELGFLLCAMGVIVFAVRMKQVRFLLLLGGVLLVAIIIGLAFSS